MAPKPKEKTKPSPAPSQPPPPIEDLFASLNKHIQRSEFQQAVKVADQGRNSFSHASSRLHPFSLPNFSFNLFLVNDPFFVFFLLFRCAVLSIAPGDEDAIRCKVVALIKDDNMNEALSTINQKPSVDFSFFKVGNFGIFSVFSDYIHLLR